MSKYLLPLCAFSILVAAPAELCAATDPGTITPSQYQALKWRLIGPFRGGRVTTVAGHPDQPNSFYQGATGGGVWKTNDAGQTWQNISDGFFRTTTIGAIAVAPSDPNIIYVGTGEAPVRGVATSHGDGVYKSEDGGKTWRRLGLEATRQISRIQVDPANPDLVYVAAQGNPWAPSDARGIYRSNDGGKSWTRILFVDSKSGASDISMAPSSPRLLYAAFWDHQRLPWTVRSGGPGSSIWRSEDGGVNWTRLGGGLPKLMGRIGVAVSPADPNRVWAMVEAAEGGVYRSDDAGRSWKRVNSDPGIRDRGWYYSHIFAHPTDRERVYVLAAPMVVSKDGGVTFDEIRTPHGDNHDLWINPRNPNVMVQGNDGGANVSLNGGQSWSTQMNQPTGQFYRIETDDLFPYRIYSAQQDNTSVRIESRSLSGGIGERNWQPVGGGESSFFGVSRKDPSLVYATGLLGGLTEYDTKTGVTRDVDPYPTFAGFQLPSRLKYRFNWNAPVTVSQHNPTIVYHGGNKLLRTTDRGRTWQEISPELTRARRGTMGTTGGPIMIEGAGGEHYATLTYIKESPHSADVIWTGSDDGLVHLTRDGGAHWSNVTPKGLPEAQINAIEVSPHDPGTAYIAVAGYKLNNFDPIAYRTRDWGRTWTPIAAGFPAGNFVRVIREDPVRKGLLYAGTEGGAFLSFDDGGHWQSLQQNLPVVPVTDLQVHGSDLVASTQGRAIWVMDGLEPLREASAQFAAEPIHLFKPAPALRVEAGGRGAANEGANPPEGATIFYSFAEAPKGEVTIDILDANGALVRHFTSEAKTETSRQLVKGAQGEPAALPVPKLAGQNRYSWNLRAAPTERVGDTIRFVQNRPYRVGPGTYRVRLAADGRIVEQELQVLPHPGLAPATPEQWQNQQALLRSLNDLVSDVHRETNSLRFLAQQVRAGAAAAPRNRSLEKKSERFLRKLAEWEEQVPQSPLPENIQDRIGYPSRLLSTQILHLMAIIDQPPPVSSAAEARAVELKTQWAGLKSQAASLRAQGLSDFSVDAPLATTGAFSGALRDEGPEGDDDDWD